MDLWTVTEIVFVSIVSWELTGWVIDQIRATYRWKCQRTNCFFKISTNDKGSLTKIRDTHLQSHPLGIKKETSGQRND